MYKTSYLSYCRPKILIQKDIHTPMLIAALFTIAKIRKQPKCALIDEWIKKIGYIYPMEYCLAIKKNKILHFDNMDGPRGYYTN